MATLPSPVIVVPGITASYLRDDYSLSPEFPWTVMTKDYERVSLHPDNLLFEALEPARLQPDQVYSIAYRELIEELRHNLSPKADQPVPVYPFGYDWRQPLKLVEAKLSDFVDEVIERTKLMRHYAADGYAKSPRVNLVGHSMGGLVIAGYLQGMQGGARKIGKVATLASPFRGSFESVVKIATGTANMGGDVPSSREREAARLMPSMYHLFPSMSGDAIKVDAGLSSSSLPKSGRGRAVALLEDSGRLNPRLFDVGLVQPTVMETIAEYIRLHGVDKSDRGKKAHELLTLLLRDALDHRCRIESMQLESAKLVAEDWLCVVGVGSETRVSMSIENQNGKPAYSLSSEGRRNVWTPEPASATEGEQARRLTGDGTVPFEGAVPGFLQERNLVCVAPSDFGYWELQDRTVSSLSGFHGILPNMNMLHRLIATHFKVRPRDRVDKYGNIWGRPAPGIKAEDWEPAIPDLEPKFKS